MGDYNVCCSISGISINGGDKIAYVPLETSRFANRIGDGNNILIYRHCFYSPVTLPVFGTYDSYGGVKDIEQNHNTETIEKLFKAKIKDIISLVKMKKPISSGMFVHRDVYDFSKTNLVDEWGKTRDSIKYNFGNSLESLFDKHQNSLMESKRRRKKSIDLWRSFPQDKETAKHIKYHKKTKILGLGLY